MKKKALIFIEDGSYTYDNRVIREASALVDAGWDITVVCPKYSDDPFKREINDALRIYFYPKPNAENVLGHIFEHMVSLILGSALTFYIAIRHGFSVFHACNPMDILWLVALPYKLAGKKFIFDHHDLCPELLLSRKEGNKSSFFYKTLIFLEKFSFRMADVVITTNTSYKDVAVRRGGKKEDSIFVVRNGPDLNKFKKVPPKNGLKKENEILVGYLGNMNYQDGVDYLLKTAKHVVSNRQDIKFVLIGGGGYQANLKELAADMGLNGNVIFTGRLPDEEMLQTLCACDICVQPDPVNALNNVSTMNKAMEYMALEKPVITFDLKETRVSCGEAAIYVTPNNTEEFAEKILHLADNTRLRKRMARKAMERVSKYLSWDHSIPYLLKAYDFALKR
ncbi:MAG: glycosyltransferase family 4 protein [Proteobacteria bacterium]|nr:glycosyltransferase family 4 protein [Pseudomonadota bacterium]